MNKSYVATIAFAVQVIAFCMTCSVGPRVAGSTPADDFPNALTASVKDANNKPVKGAIVYIRHSDFLSDTASALPVPDAVTDSDGKFFFDSLPNGSYSIEVRYDSVGAAVQCSLYAQEKNVKTLDNLSLSTPGSITGAVGFLGKGKALVRVYGFLHKATLDSLSGTFTVNNLPPCNYSMQVAATTDPSLPPVDVADIAVESGFQTSVGTVVLAAFDKEDYGLWPYSRTIHLNTTAQGADVTDTVYNFPVLVRLDASKIAFGQVSADGHDIRFAKANGTHLHYEIEQWDAANKTAAVWVLVDTVYGNATTDIEMYWGRKVVADFSQPSSVFTNANGNLGVWHMNTQSDASGQGHTLTTSSDATMPLSDSGMVGTAMRFDGANDFLTVPYRSDLDGKNQFSISVWVQWLGASIPGYNRIISNKHNWNESTGFELCAISGNDNAIDVRAEDSLGNGPLNAINGWTKHSWQYVTLVWNSGVCSIYVNGSLVGAPLINAYPSVNDIVFGSNVGNTEQEWNGRLDEIRMSSGSLSGAWIKLCYMNQKTLDALCK